MKLFFQTFLLLLILSTAWGAGASDEDRLTTVGLNLFPNIVSIDEDITEKRADDGNIYLLITYEYQSLKAGRLAEKLRSQVTSIKKFPVIVKVIKASELNSFSKLAAGIFLSERMDDKRLKNIIAWASQHRTLLFSPFTGDVERGVTMGMQITSKIWPYCNTKTLELSNIHFHPTFMKIMRCYSE